MKNYVLVPSGQTHTLQTLRNQMYTGQHAPCLKLLLHALP